MEHMKGKLFSSILLAAVLSAGAAVQAQDKPLAFPTAEGWGRNAWGGRGGRVLTVTNLADAGEGSLRWAVEQSGARTVVFAVDGTIALKSPLRVNNDSITIAGQTAPGDGICLKDYPLVINASDVVVRYLRVRPGDAAGKDFDAVGGGRYGQHDVILDHISASWSVDECLSIYKTHNLTVQWCLVSHSLCKSVHTKGSHGFGGIWGGDRASFHHNLLANHSSRNPRFSSVDGTKWVDYRNNAVFNWGFKAAYGGGHHGEINFCNNYYKPGPATTNRRFLDVAEDGTSKYYVAGNMMAGDTELTANNRLGVGDKTDTCSVDKPFPVAPIKEQSAEEAFFLILNQVGCSHRRDSYDTQVIRQVRTGKTPWGRNGIIDAVEEAGGWPILKSGRPLVDTDGDGMPDKWEKKHHLNPNDPTDGNAYTLSSDYTNLEVYLDQIVNR